MRVWFVNKGEAYGLEGAFAPPALKAWITQHLPTIVAGSSCGQTGLPTPRPPPMFLKIIFLRPPGWLSRGEPPGVPERGGCKPHRGLGAQPPAVGAEGGAGRAGGSNAPPSGGLLSIRFRARKNQSDSLLFLESTSLAACSCSPQTANNASPTTNRPITRI